MSRSAGSLLLAFASALALGCTDTPLTSVAPPASASPRVATPNVPSLDRDDRGGGRFPFATTYAVIGDIPYGPVKRAELPRLVDQINADDMVSGVVHLGDIRQGKNGVTEPLGGCADAQLLDIRAQFDRFQKPLVYTPGDNEWADCHVDGKKNNGFYVPTERLQRLREIFYPVPGLTLGAPRLVLSQALDPRHSDYVENVMWLGSGVVFAAVNVPGSDDDAAIWGAVPNDGAGYPTQDQERAARDKANADWIDAAFDAATALRAPGVVLAMQADFWNIDDPVTHLTPLMEHIGTRAIQYGKPVLLLQGDSHLFRADQPYTPSFPLAYKQPTAPIAPNVTRIVVQGELNPTEYVRLTIDPRPSATLFTWERVPLAP